MDIRPIETFLRSYRQAMHKRREVGPGGMTEEEKGCIRPLTLDEWNALLEWVCEDKEIVLNVGSEFGFSVRLEISRHPFEVYPGAKEPPTLITFLLQDHIPIGLLDADGKVIEKTPGGELFDVGWRAFAPLVHNDDMRARRIKHGLKPAYQAHEIDY